MPKQNRIPIEIAVFGKVNEDVSIDKLQQGEIPLMHDMILDRPFRKPHIRGGFNEVSDTGTANVDKLFNLQTPDGTEYVISSHSGGTVRKTSDGSAWSTISSMGTAGGFRIISFGDRFFFTNGVDAPKELYGDSLTKENLEITPPDVTDVIIQGANSAVGDLDADSIYMWMLVYATDTGEISQVSNPFTQTVEDLTTPANYLQTTSTGVWQQFLFTDLPVSSDTRVTKKYLYRTEGWDLSTKDTALTFYLHTKLDNDITQFVDGLADDDLDFSNKITFTRVPNSAKYGLTINNRLVLANVNVNLQASYAPMVVAESYGSNQTVDSVTYNDPQSNPALEGNIFPYNDIVGADGLTPNKYYLYMYTYVDKEGLESRPSMGKAFQVGATGTYREVTTMFYDEGRLGASLAEINPNLTKRRIYRTTGQTSSFITDPEQLKLVEEQDLTNNPLTSYFQYTDTTNDGDLGANYAVETEDYESAIIWSEPNQPSYFKLESIKDIYAEKGNPITGIFDDGNGVLIFKKNLIAKLYMNGSPENWYVRKLWTKFGCDEPLSLVKIGSTIFFRFNKKTYSYVSEQVPEYIGFGKQTTLNDMTIKGVDGTDDWLIYSAYDGSDYYALVYDLKVETWYQFNLGSSNTNAVFVKSYDDFWNENFIYLSDGQKIYEYQINVTSEDISGSSITIQPSLTLPLIRSSESFKSKLRDIKLQLEGLSNTGTITLTLDTQDHSYSDSLYSTSGLRRISGFNGKEASPYFKVNLAGDLKSFQVGYFSLRPSRRLTEVTPPPQTLAIVYGDDWSGSGSSFTPTAGVDINITGSPTQSVYANLNGKKYIRVSHTQSLDWDSALSATKANYAIFGVVTYDGDTIYIAPFLDFRDGSNYKLILSAHRGDGLTYNGWYYGQSSGLSDFSAISGMDTSKFQIVLWLMEDNVVTMYNGGGFAIKTGVFENTALDTTLSLVGLGNSINIHTRLAHCSIYSLPLGQKFSPSFLNEKGQAIADYYDCVTPEAVWSTLFR